MKDAFEQNDVYLDEIERQNDLLKDQLLEASLKHDIELCVLLNHECADKSLHDELEQVKKKSLKIQEGLKERIKILEKDVQRCEKQSVDFELKLQHEKEKHKWDSSKNKNSKPLDFSWISRIQKLEDENVSLDFKVQSLIKERDNAKMEYKKLFDSIKKTRSQTQKEMDELIAHVSEKTYAYGAIRAENQNLLDTISELKARMKNGENGKSVNTKFDKTHGSQSFLCVTPLNKNASQKQTVVLKTKENHVESKPVTLQTSHNKQTGTHQNTNVIDNTFAKVVSNKWNVIDVVVANAFKAKTLLCVSCMQNVLIPCHDKYVAKHKLNVRLNVRRTFFTNSRIPKSLETTYVALKTRFSKKETQSKTLDTTSVISKSNIDVESASKAKDKVVQIVLWVVDSGCSKHMTGDRSLLRNFVEKFMGTVRFGNDNFAAITGYGIMQQFSIARTPQQNGVVERRNRTLVEAARTMLIFSRLPEFLWAEAVATACFTQNRSIINTRHNKTPYELLRGRKPNVEYFHVFGSLCYPTNDRDDLGKMKPKADIGVFIGYSETSRDDLMNNPSKEDLDNLFGPMFEDYFEQKSFDTNINSAAQLTHDQEDSPSTSSIIVDTHEAPPVVTTSDEQTSLISLQESDEFNQEDSADFDGNTQFVPYDSLNHEEIKSSTTNLEPSNVQNFHQVQPSTHI
ncbi:retrovirus-related pol polyprotein from transposon TNT 1-94 [Tanacetum coccineum]